WPARPAGWSAPRNRWDRCKRRSSQARVPTRGRTGTSRSAGAGGLAGGKRSRRIRQRWDSSGVPSWTILTRGPEREPAHEKAEQQHDTAPHQVNVHAERPLKKLAAGGEPENHQNGAVNREDESDRPANVQAHNQRRPIRLSL